MLIANPIYDTNFKYLMEDSEIARKLLGLIIDEEIVALDLKPQEQSHLAELLQVHVFRMDFKATIRTADGDHKQILIELQKSNHLFDIMRFRKYLGENYARAEQVRLANGEVVNLALPIITIYFLGFSLDRVGTALLKVNRTYLDLQTQQVLEVKNDFIEKLTHDCYVIQIPRLPLKWRSRLERILTVFDQRHQTDDRKVLDVEESWSDDPLLEQIVNRLGRAALTPEVRRQAGFEEEIDGKIGDIYRRAAYAETMLTQTQAELAQAESARIRTETELAHAESARIRTEAELTQAESARIRTEAELASAKAEVEELRQKLAASQS